VVKLILMFDTSGIFLFEQENKTKQRVIATIDNLIANNAFEVLTLQSERLINKYKVKFL
jgi:hypothetical protein